MFRVRVLGMHEWALGRFPLMSETVCVCVRARARTPPGRDISLQLENLPMHSTSSRPREPPPGTTSVATASRGARARWVSDIHRLPIAQSILIHRLPIAHTHAPARLVVVALMEATGVARVSAGPRHIRLGPILTDPTTRLHHTSLMRTIEYAVRDATGVGSGGEGVRTRVWVEGDVLLLCRAARVGGGGIPVRGVRPCRPEQRHGRAARPWVWVLGLGRRFNAVRMEVGRMHDAAWMSKGCARLAGCGELAVGPEKRGWEALEASLAPQMRQLMKMAHERWLGLASAAAMVGAMIVQLEACTDALGFPGTYCDQLPCSGSPGRCCVRKSARAHHSCMLFSVWTRCESRLRHCNHGPPPRGRHGPREGRRGDLPRLFLAPERHCKTQSDTIQENKED